MAKTTQDTVSGNGLLKSLRASPVGQRLTEEATRLIDAQADKLTGKLNNGVGALSKMTESGQFAPLAKGAGKFLETGKPVSGALTAAKSAVTEKAKDVIGLGKGQSKGRGTGKGKQVNIEESIDIGVPVSVAYNQWTQFKDFSRFMKGVESVEQTSDTETNWRAKVFKSRRTWKATIQEQIPDQRIVWTSEGSKGSTKGAVTFHPLAENLTRVLLTLEYYPVGVMEKTGNIWRAAGRRARLDLKNYRRYLMLEGEETGSWRGKIEEGEVVEQPDEQSEGGQPRKAGGRSSESQSGSRRPQKAQKAQPQKATARKAAPRKDAARKASPQKASPRKDAARKAPPQKAAPRKDAARKASPQKASPRKAAPRKATAAAGQGRTPRKQTARASSSSSGSSGSSRGRKAQPAKRTSTRRRSSS